MNNLNSQSQNTNIQSQNPIVNNILAEYIKNCSNPLMPLNNAFNTNDPLQNSSSNFESIAQQNQKDLLNNILQKHMLANLFGQNLPNLTPINGLIKPQQISASGNSFENSGKITDTKKEEIHNLDNSQPNQQQELCEVAKQQMENYKLFSNCNNVVNKIENLNASYLSNFILKQTKNGNIENSECSSNSKNLGGNENNLVKDDDYKKSLKIQASNQIAVNQSQGNLPFLIDETNNSSTAKINISNSANAKTNLNNYFDGSISFKNPENNSTNTKDNNKLDINNSKIDPENPIKISQVDDWKFNENQFNNLRGSNINGKANSVNILNILQLTSALLNNNQNKGNLSAPIDPNQLISLLANKSQNFNENNVSTQNSNNSLNNLKYKNGNINMPLNNQIPANNPMNNSQISSLNFLSALGNICKSNNNNNFNLNNNFNYLNSSSEQTPNFLSNTYNPSNSILGKIEENDILNNSKQAASIANINESSQNNTSLKNKIVSNNLNPPSNEKLNNNNNNFNTHYQNLEAQNPSNFSSNNESKSLQNSNTIKELLINSMNNSSKDKNINALNNSNLFKILMQAQQNSQNNSEKLNMNLMNLASNNSMNNSANSLGSLNSNSINLNNSSANSQNLNVLNVLQKLMGMANKNINNSTSNSQNCQNIRDTKNSNNENIDNCDNNINSNVKTNLNSLNINNFQQSSNSNFTNLGNNPLLNLLTLINNHQKNQIAVNSNNTQANANSINTQNSDNTSNRLKDIVNTLPHVNNLGSTQPKSTLNTAKAENSKTSPENNKSLNEINEINKSNQNISNTNNLNTSSSQNISQNMQYNPIASLLNILNLSGDFAQSKFPKNIQNSNESEKEENANSNNNNQSNNHSKAFENADNPLFKLNSNQNNVTNFNIFNNLFNIPFNYQKPFGYGRNTLEELKNNLLNIGAFNNFVKAQNNANNTNSQNNIGNDGNLTGNNAPDSLNNIFSINYNSNQTANNMNNNLAGLLQNKQIFNNFNAVNQKSSNQPQNSINNLNALTTQLQNYNSNNNSTSNKFKAMPVNNSNLKNFNNQSQNAISNIQNTLNNFSDKQQNNIKQVKYPLEDSELFKDPRLYAIDPKILIRPEGKIIEIEGNMLNKLIIIWDFLTHFNQLLEIEEEIISEDFFGFLNKISCNSFHILPPKEVLTIEDDVENRMEIEEKINKEQEANNDSEVNEKILESECNKQVIQPLKKQIELNINENFEIFEKVLIKLSKLFSTSLREHDITDDMKVEKDLFIIKFCSENNFSDLENFYSKCYPEILRILVNSKRFGLMANDSIKLNIEKRLKFLNSEERIEILFYLVNSAFDLTSIKQIIKYESDLGNELLRERNTLDNDLKSKENRKREIEKMEKFLTAPEKIELLTERINKLDEDPDEILKIYKETNVTKLKKDLDIERERYKGLMKEHEELGNVKSNILARLDEIRTELNSLNLRNKKKIGQDYKKNDYFVFEKIPNHLFVYVKNQNFKLGLGCIKINSEPAVNSGSWFYYDSYDEILTISNLLTEKGLREKNLKSALKKLISRKFFSNELKDNQEKSLIEMLNNKYKEATSLKIASKEKQRDSNFLKESKVQVEREIYSKMDLDVTNEIRIFDKKEEDKNKLEVNTSDKILYVENKTFEKNENINNNIDHIHEIENQNKMLNEIMDDIQNIDNVNNNLDNILENEAHIELLNNNYLPISDRNSANLQYKRSEENKSCDIQMILESDNIVRDDKQAIQCQLNQERKSNLDDCNDEKNLYEESQENHKAAKFEDEEDMENLKSLKNRLLAMEEKFSEYLKQYEKEWDSPSKRIQWRKHIEENYEFYNILLSIKMLNFRFKNPYKSDELPLSDEELNQKDNPTFVFKGKNESLKIHEIDNTRLLAPKGAVYGLIKRRDPYKKASIKETTLGLDNNRINYGNPEIETNYFENNPDNFEETIKNQNIIEKPTIQSFTSNQTNNIQNTNPLLSTSRTRSSRLMNNGNYHLTYNLNTIFNQAGLSNEAIKAAGKSSKPKKLEKQNKESLNESINKQVNKNEESIHTEGNIDNNNKYIEEENIDETLSDNNISKKKKSKISNLKKSKIKLSKLRDIEYNTNKNTNLLENTNIENNINNILNEDNLALQDANIKTDTLSEHITEENHGRKTGNKNSKKSIGNKKEKIKNSKKLLNNKRNRIQEEVQEEQLENEISSSSNNDDEEDYSESNEKSKKKSKNIKKNTLTNKKFPPSLNVKNNNNNNINFKINDSDIAEDFSKSKMQLDYDEDLDSFQNDEIENLNNPKIEKNTKNQGNKLKENFIKEEITEENSANLIHSKNISTSKNKNPKIEEKPYNKISFHRSNENDFDYSSSLRPNKPGKMISRYLNKSAEAAEEENTLITGKSKRLTRSTNTEVIKEKWKDKCYICLEYGDLICCEACSNVAHKFCACIERIPDKWYCQKCEDKNTSKREKEEK